MSTDLGKRNRQRFTAVLLHGLSSCLMAGGAWAAVEGECARYTHYLLPETVVWVDDFQFQTEIHGEVMITCRMIANTQPRGPFPADCKSGEESWDTWFSFYPSQDGDPGALLLFQNEVWYRDCR